ncbi:MAG: putative flap endonuclease-1-like 5' DNA nuclease [Bacteroidia bacterium]|jgi:predicted flap endonuclease-1-like 5' DNA nuclease
MILLDIFGQNPFQGPGTGTFTEHLMEIVAMLLVAFLLGWWIARIAVAKWRNKFKESESELSLMKAEALGLDDKKLEINTLNEKVKLLEDKNSRLRLEASQPVVNSANSILEAKLKTQDQLINKLKADVEDWKGRQINLDKQSGIIKKVATAAKPVEQIKKVTKDPMLSAKVETTSVVEPKDKSKAKSKSKGKAKSKEGDDLKKIEGVGPKIEQLLNADGIKSYDDIVASGADKIREVLLKAGPQYKVHDPSTWGEQSKLAKAEKWDELYEMQANLKGGKKV